MSDPIEESRTGGPPNGSDGGVAAMRRLFERQRAAWRAEGAPPLGARVRALDGLAGLLTCHADEIAAAIGADFGHRARPETRLLEILPALRAVRHARRNLARWMAPSRRRVAWLFKPGAAWVQYQPVGVVGVIAAWNYPILLTVGPLIDALAAGNRVMLKPSERTVHCAGVLKRRLAEVFPEETVAVIPGGPAVADAFSRLPFDHLLFTGSASVGRQVMAAAAANLTPLTLELGGKSPVLMCPDYDVRRAARDIAFGKFSNAGQTCVAPDYVLAPAASAGALAEAVLDQARHLYPTIGANPDYTSIMDEAHFERLARIIAEARNAGAAVLAHDDEQARAARKIGPTIVLDPPEESPLLRDEIFGPILPIVRYHTLDEAIARINAGGCPLALYCLTHDAVGQEQVLSRTMSGGVTLNGTLLHFAQEDLPFGGVGASGFGAYHGWHGFIRFSHARAVYQVRRFNILDIVSPPYGRRVDLITALLIRR